MELKQYQAQALTTATYPGKGTFSGLSYTALKLNGEAGEVAEKVGKCWRDNQGVIPLKWQSLALELGDVLWYIAALANELGYSLNEIAELNLVKLQDRKVRGVLGGSGDNR